MRVLVVAGSALARAALSELVGGDGRHAVAAATGFDTATAALVDLEPDVTVLELGAAGGIDLAMAMASGSDVPLVVVVEEAEDALDIVAMGAAAAVPAGLAASALGATIEAAGAGLKVLPREALPPPGEAPAARGGDDDPVEALTARETQVLQLMAGGLTNAEIAARLGLSPHTAKFHVGVVLGKLRARSRAEAVARASRLGWILV